MVQNEFLAQLSLPRSAFPSAVRWAADLNGPVTAAARLDYEPASGDVEYGIYEMVDGETTYVTGLARRDAQTGEMTFRDDTDEALFERFAETVRLMQVETIVDAEVSL